MQDIQIDGFISFTLAILLWFVGKYLSSRHAWLRRYSIPEPVIGGVLCAALVCVIFYVFDVRVAFDLNAREMLLLYFFAALGLSTDIRLLGQGGRALLILTVVATVCMVLQNMLGMGVAEWFGMDARLGLMSGSISLTGGVGTTMAWAPHFSQDLGLSAAADIGLAANMVGLLAACIVGGPIASYLIRRYRIPASNDPALDVGTLHGDEPFRQLNYLGVLLAIFWLNITLMAGQVLGGLIEASGLNLPDFVGCLMAGIAIRTLGDVLARKRYRRLWHFPRMKLGVALVSDISLGMFLTMALMGLQFWALRPMLGFLTMVMGLQILFAVGFTLLVVFRTMGRDYEAAVMAAGFGGIALGSTATAVANMTAVTRQYGAAPRAFLVVPLVCGFFIDLINAIVIGLML